MRSSRFASPGTRDLLLDHRAVGDARGPRLARQAGDERLEALEALLVEAPQLGERLGVIVDAEVEERIVLGRVDQQRRGLLAALVAARRLARLERREQPLGERQAQRSSRKPRRSPRAPAVPRACCRRPRSPRPRDARTSRCTRVPVCAAMRPCASITCSCRVLAAFVGRDQRARLPAAAMPSRQQIEPPRRRRAD